MSAPVRLTDAEKERQRIRRHYRSLRRQARAAGFGVQWVMEQLAQRWGRAQSELWVLVHASDGPDAEQSAGP